MKINNNISAVITNKQLLRTEDSLAGAMERLSSGLRINHAADDPSGMAISGKMDIQIEALDLASRNANDGISVIQTADGAMNEVTSMIQRMRELSVQAANGINSLSDKQQIQAEISQLREEIDRISSSTEFNTKQLLDGSLDERVYADKVSRIAVSDSVAAGFYKLKIDKAAQPASIATTFNGSQAVPAGAAGSISINGAEVTLTKGMTGEEVEQALRDAAEIGEVDYPTVKTDALGNTTKSYAFTTKEYGAHAGLTITGDENVAKFLGLTMKNGVVVDGTEKPSGKDAVVSLTTWNQDAGSEHRSQFSDTATVTTDGNRMKITDKSGFSIEFLADDGVKGDLELEVTTMGPMTLQIGANENQSMMVRIPSISADNLYLDSIDVTTVNGASKAIATLDEALARVNQVRADLGAAQNRLEHTTKSLDETSENMTSALSRIEDVDMAQEMTEYTKYNVLQQAGTSALAQANQIPQMALQLLQ